MTDEERLLRERRLAALPEQPILEARREPTW